MTRSKACALTLRQRLFAVRGVIDEVSGVPQRVDDRARQPGFVLDDEDRPAGHAPRPARARAQRRRREPGAR